MSEPGSSTTVRTPVIRRPATAAASSRAPARVGHRGPRSPASARRTGPRSRSPARPTASAPADGDRVEQRPELRDVAHGDDDRLLGAVADRAAARARAGPTARRCGCRPRATPPARTARSTAAIRRLAASRAALGAAGHALHAGAERRQIRRRASPSRCRRRRSSAWCRPSGPRRARRTTRRGPEWPARCAWPHQYPDRSSDERAFGLGMFTAWLHLVHNRRGP